MSRITSDILATRPIERSLYVYSRELLNDRLNHLKSVFPAGTNHAVAIKSNSHPEVLAEITQQGCGLEAASYEEVLLAAQANCPFDKIVFDSPVKTVQEIESCAKNYPGMTINANCFEELNRLKGMMEVNVGIRINPLVDIESPGIYNVSHTGSKFGIPISQRSEIVQYALKMDNVSGLHIHAGSEIGSRVNHIKAISSVVQIAEEIASKGKKLEFIDIGGGISASLEGLESFFQALIAHSPEILNYQIITEYGRFVQTHCAFVISKVEYLLSRSETDIALIHVGADLFPREIYSSAPPHHDYLVINQEGQLKLGNEKKYDIGGPLCFSGDFLKRGIELPEIDAGDFIIITDAGANSLSMWSSHCSREEVEVKIL
ncbi:type III PLP-dependent enzyme domain-containing protein [Portibacter marinus]|uniref:hypothetical protein n=1 Tax=Portibacter marinus TaxID=2898660 RepID=UPI001F1FC7B9|nr:hypothetical protein [Portibacter marinus]